MSNEIVPRDRPADGLHPYVYAGIAALVVWFVLAVWWSFAADGYADYILAIISGFILTFVSFALLLSRVSQGDDPAADDTTSRRSFRRWATREFDTCNTDSKPGTPPLKSCCRSPRSRSE